MKRTKTSVCLAIAAAAIMFENATFAQYQPGERVYSPPPFGTFWTIQTGWTNMAWAAPLPFFPFDPVDVPLYAITNDSFFFEFDWNTYSDSLTNSSPLPAGLMDESPLSDSGPDIAAHVTCDDYGKRFRFSSITVTSGVIHLTLTNTVAGFDYTIWRTATLSNPAWSAVQTLTATGFVAVASPIAAGADRSGFFRASLASDPLGLGWTTSLPDGSISSSAAAAGDCTVFVSAQNHLYALDFAGGAIKWVVGLNNADPFDLAPSPAVAPDSSAVFVASQSGAVLALSPADGSLLWSNFLGLEIDSSPAISAADGTLYVATQWSSGGGGLFALNPATGATNWFFQQWTPLIYGIISDASVAIGPDCTIYFVSTGADLYAVRPDGSLAWFFPFPAGSAPESSPAFDSAGNILVGSADGYVYCISPSGGLRWLFSTGDGQPVSSPAIGADSTVYAATAGGSLFAVTNGGFQWKYTPTAPPLLSISSPAVNSSNAVFIGSAHDPGGTNGLLVITNGALSAFYTTAEGIWGSPVITRNSAIIADLAGYVYKFPGAGYPAATSPWPQFRLNSLHTGATPNPACASSSPPYAFPNNPAMTTDGTQFSFYLTGTPGSAWGIFASTNLTDWTAIGAVGLDSATGSAQFTDTTAAGVTNRFYRAHCALNCSRVIGFVHQIIRPGTNLIANHLFQINDGYYPQNAAKGWTDLLLGPPRLPTPPNQTELRKWNGAGFDSVKWDGILKKWLPNGDLTLLPGQAFFAINPTNQPVTLPFMGLLAPDPASNSIASGATFISSLLPKAGRIHTDLGFNPNDGDKVLQWQTNNYFTNIWSASTGWSGGEPSLRVGEGFLLLTSQSNNWVAGSPTCPSELAVPSNPLWTDSCLTVTNGDIISFPTSGTWSPDNSNTVAGANGTGFPVSDQFLGPAAWASLIAFVGPDPYSDDQGVNHWGDASYFPRPLGTNYYFVGTAGVFTNTLRPGKLWFGFNDDAVGQHIADNLGFLHGILHITHP
jgi:outer membrane protein assembly factor BamB